MGAMELPGWALRALAHFKPLLGYRGDAPDPERLMQWEGFNTRFRQRWNDLAPDNWRVPENHQSYSYLEREYRYPPSEYVRQCILECAIESAWEMGANKSPGAVVEAVREMDRINDKISECAATLATLFRQRDQLMSEYGLSDQRADVESELPDAFKLEGVLELTLSKDRFRTADYEYKEGLATLYTAIASSRRDAPTIADVLDEISYRQPRMAAPFEAGDIAVVGSRTNKSPWSPWALRMIARLGDWPGNGLPRTFFLDCLTNEQLSVLAEVSCDAPPGAFNSEQMRKLRTRHAQRVSEQGRFGAV
jgi:hypothetical protein